jgi:hypothetical protein
MIPVARKVLLVALAAVATLIMQRYVGEQTIYDPQLDAKRDSVHQAILANRLPAGKTWADYGATGFTARVLSVYIAEGLHRTLNLALSKIYFIIDTVALFSALLALYAFLRLWVPPNLALVGLLFTCLVLPLTYAFHFFHPWDRLSFLIWIGLLYCLGTGRTAAFATLLVIGTFVKYDVILLPALYFLASIKKENAFRVSITTLALFVLSLGTYAGLVAHFGAGLGDRSHVGAQVLKNLADIRENHIWYPPLLAFTLPVALAIMGWRTADRFARAAAAFAGLLAVPLFLASNFREVRAEMPLLVLLLPCALVGLTATSARDGTSIPAT